MTLSEKTQQIISSLNLEQHPEGGYYRETYRSEMVLESEFGTRNVGTAIYFLLPENVVSEWHVVRSDEMWHFYDGAPLVLEVISPEGQFEKMILGNQISQGHFPQHLVPANWWQRAYSLGEFTLVGCTVKPGFDFVDFEMGNSSILLQKFSHLSEQLNPTK